MPNTAVHPPQAGGSLANATNQPHPHQQLRRAVYIHVSDLTNAYNIDHARLEEELARVKKNRETAFANEGSGTGGGAGGAGSSAGGVNATTGSIPTELDTSLSPKRLQPPRSGFNVCVLVGDVNVVVDKGRVDGSRVRLAEVEVGDETGVVSLRARNEQIDLLKQVSERSGAVVLRNCTLELYQGKHVRLVVTKWGKLSTYPDQVASTPPPPSKMNPERNFSLIDLSLVASEMVVQAEQYGQSSSEGGAATTGANRQPSFQTGGTTSRRGAGRRGSPRGKLSGHNPISMPVHYSEQGGMVPAMRYQPYPGGYGETQPYSYPQQQQGQHSYPQQQQQQGQMMMHQQQYEMQQRQMQQQGHMQHQMYHTGAPQDRQHPGHSPMVLAISTAGSFDNAYNAGSETPMPLLGSVNQFLMPIPGGGISGASASQLQHQHQQAHSPPSTHYPSHGSPISPGQMSAHAATFDPTSSSRTNKPGSN